MAEITETENDHDEDDAGPQPRVTDAPMEIWLQYGDELLVDTPHSVLARDGEVSWCDSQVFPFDVKYVRADEIDRLRAHVADTDGAITVLGFQNAELRARVAELEAAKGEPVAFLHQVVCGDGEPDQALSFAPDNFPLAGVLGYRSLSYVPLYTTPQAPVMDVDAISEEAILRTQRAVWAECGRDVNAKLIRTVVDAIFNKGE